MIEYAAEIDGVVFIDQLGRIWRSDKNGKLIEVTQQASDQAAQQQQPTGVQ